MQSLSQQHTNPSLHHSIISFRQQFSYAGKVSRLELDLHLTRYRFVYLVYQGHENDLSLSFMLYCAGVVFLYRPESGRCAFGCYRLSTTQYTSFTLGTIARCGIWTRYYLFASIESHFSERPEGAGFYCLFDSIANGQCI